eukprot:3154621-Alexandrium_andersonii.AAC.1
MGKVGGLSGDPTGLRSQRLIWQGHPHPSVRCKAETESKQTPSQSELHGAKHRGRSPGGR